MKGLLLAVLSFVILVGVSMSLLRLYRGKKYFKVFLIAFAFAVGMYSYLHWVFSHDLGFLPQSFLEPHATLDFVNGLLVLALFFHSFWDVVYTTALTGFSGHLTVLLACKGGLSRKEILSIYGANDEIDRVLAWRLPNLLQGGYLEAQGSGFHLRPKGWAVARLTRLLKRMLTACEEGG